MWEILLHNSLLRGAVHRSFDVVAPRPRTCARAIMMAAPPGGAAVAELDLGEGGKADQLWGMLCISAKIFRRYAREGWPKLEQRL